MKTEKEKNVKNIGIVAPCKAIFKKPTAEEKEQASKALKKIVK